VRRRRVLAAVLTFTAATACGAPAAEDTHNSGIESAAATVQGIVVRDIDSLAAAVDALEGAVRVLNGSAAALSEAHLRFARARRFYKRIEYIAAYYSPTTTDLMNGPALPRVEEDEGPDVVFPPEGFQVIEEQLFPAADTAVHEVIVQEVRNLAELVTRLRTATRATPLTDARVFDALRVGLARVLSLGLSGFDSPVALHSIAEAADALRGMRDGFDAYARAIQRVDPASAARIDSSFAAAISVLEREVDFAAFDRLGFIIDHANPLGRQLLRAQEALGIQPLQDPRPLRAGAATMFERDAFDPMAFAAPNTPRHTPSQVALGARLFFEPLLSGPGTRSCASCHMPERGFTDGLARSNPLPGRAGAVLRNAPTVINAGLQAGTFADLRTAYLEDQVEAVLGNPDEMHGSLDAAARALKARRDYVDLFAAAFDNRGDSTVTGGRVRTAIAAYVRSLSRLDSRFDRHVRGDSALLSVDERLGFNLFMGKAKCGTCHFLPLFNGTVPPAYQETDVEVLGVPANQRGSKIDPDIGRAAVTRALPHRHAFRTPTVRNVELTAPYMHNGVYRTLEEVVDFYDAGGGVGLGLSVPNQTLPADSLRLTPAERRALVAFMKSLTDTAFTTARPP